MFRQVNRLLTRPATSQILSRNFATEVAAVAEPDAAFVEVWKKVAPSIEPPKTPSSFMKPRPPVPSSIPSKITVNFVLPYASQLSTKEVDMIIIPATTGQMGVLAGHVPTTTFFPPAKILSPKPVFSFSVSSFHRNSPWFLPMSHSFHSLTDTRLPKTRPSVKSRRKRASIRPKGSHAWVKCVPDEPIDPDKPTEKVLKRRNEKKRMRLKREFVKSEAKKRKVLVQAAKKQKMIARVERKMAAVARDRAWTIRLAELQQIEEKKKKSTA